MLKNNKDLNMRQKGTKQQENALHNNQVFVVCEAQTMKTQLNETGQIFRHFFIMGIATKKDIFIHFLRFGLNSLT
jgi:hypothetical protein